jgi:tRNA(Ile)-lysidine synthase
MKKLKIKDKFYEDQIIIDKQKFSEESELIRYEILKRFGFNDENEMQKFLTSQTGSSFFNSEFQLVVNRNELIFNKNLEVGNEKLEEIKLEIIDNKIIIPENIKNEIQEFGHCFWKIDNKTVKKPLKLRRKT